ncbi:hypothetical protein H9Q72_003837 [Fusarium xylarioides]|uniref:Uncharacterized protein n=1 Tax=Fusarium xylarioides TaxID=221167 RepID=A0A9P7HX56_9HYPO|nr:hypothetical protein H9Q70_004229 [Fusarium xylarioides]KAG5768765.1 hypothetical protein H9Q72_003837 [Fusarium xylarioides]KAG5782016.1 hypothetical protein H9Q73_004321 [Fusarium xylarioides]KAG5803874.1 hypothetical protein H9Q71_011536 [Fusarium xylarioides]KAG5816100.1 hypothetical protein H9Q74_011306 [Fusarium xylarioides]
MRFALVWSVAFVANAAMASVCKPRSRDTSIASTESRTTMISTETHPVDTTTIATVDVSTSTATSTVDDSTTVDTTEVDISTSGLPSSLTTATTDATTISTTADATTAESTTTSDPTSSISAPEPFETFDVLAIGGGSINRQYIKGVANEGSMMGWDLTGTGIGMMPPFTIEPGTNFAKVLRNDLYLCTGYGDGIEPNFVATCDLSTSGDPYTGFLTCEQTRDRKLKCSVPGVQCVFDPDTVCTPTGGDFDKFYTYSGRSDGLWLAIDSSGKASDSNFQPIELGITPNQSK